jgi:DNA-binding response OmpR family regulator
MAVAAVAESVSKTRFDLADVLLFDPVAPNRSTSRTALGMVGFRQIFATSDFDEMIATLRSKVFDLFVADISQDATRLCNLVLAMRAGRMARNPFVHVMLMAWKLEDDLVKRALNCGADDLITRPYSVGFLSGRVKSLTEARKGFVVTSDYIGPDRRRDPGRNAGVPLFDVPNTLRLKTRGDSELARLDLEVPNAIRDARAKIGAERARRDAFQLSVLAQFLREALTATQPLDHELDRLDATMKDLGWRLEGVADEAVLMTCESLEKAIIGGKSGENVAEHVGKIEELAGTLYTALNPGRTPDDLKNELNKAITLIKSRGRRD